MALFGSSDDWVARRERAKEIKLTIRQKENQLTVVDQELAACSATLRAWMAQENRDRSDKWEYLVLDDVDESVLDAYGRDGWELVGLSSYETGFGIGGNVSTKVHLRYVFKRRMQIVEGSHVDQNKQEGSRLVKLQADLQNDIEVLLAELG